MHWASLAARRVTRLQLWMTSASSTILKGLRKAVYVKSSVSALPPEVDQKHTAYLSVSPVTVIIYSLH